MTIYQLTNYKKIMFNERVHTQFAIAMGDLIMYLCWHLFAHFMLCTWYLGRFSFSIVWLIWCCPYQYVIMGNHPCNQYRFRFNFSGTVFPIRNHSDMELGHQSHANILWCKSDLCLIWSHRSTIAMKTWSHSSSWPFAM